MTFHTTPQFHATIVHHMLFFTTPFRTTSHSVFHPGHGHSTSYNIPFHITPYNKCISYVVSFYSALITQYHFTLPSPPSIISLCPHHPVSFHSALITQYHFTRPSSPSIILLCPHHPPLLLWTLITLPVCVKLCAIGFVRVFRPYGIYVICRVQIAFHITLLNSTPH